MRFTDVLWAASALTLVAVMPKPAPTHAARPHPVDRPAAVATAAPVLPKGEKLLADIRRVFRSHRPPPPYIVYTISREQNTEAGYVDFSETYSDHVWVRSTDRAALKRRIGRDDFRGDMTFDRPAFNEDRDPGPPTADVFEPAPVHSRPVDVAPPPETNAPTQIGAVRSVGETQYKVSKVALEGAQYHLTVYPFRDLDRNHLREIYVDKNTLELQKIVATDKLFVDYGGGAKGEVYPVTFTYSMSMLEG
ncbi:MAG: hypothetical protein M3N19_02540, partial [Candidatus Eremiobacteraeota bacterium]|nr:hypothetical protein [Candidatus Eremiobacteraeota bacterium]